MILEHVKTLEVENIGETEDGISAGVSEESLPFMFEFVSTQLYSNPIGSIVREITSNCFDSHIEAKVDSPVIIRKVYDTEEGWAIEFEDVGIGMSVERVLKLYMNYFSSSKRGSNEQIGGFGLGSKTPLAYSDLFYITTIYDGFNYEYLYHKGELKPTLESLLGYNYITEEEAKEWMWEYRLDSDGQAVRTIAKFLPRTEDGLIKVPSGEWTDKHNGTIIRIPVKQEDLSQFQTDLKFQLAYFDNVYFTNWNISNDYDIYEGKYFKFRSDIDQHNTKLHLCIGNVRYSINFNTVNLPYDYESIPVAIKFDIGELKVTPSREALRYTKEDIVKIRERAGLAKEELLTLFDKENPIVDSIFKIMDGRDSAIKVTFNEEKRHFLFLWSDSGRSKRQKYAPLADLDIKYPRNLFLFWERIAKIEYGVRRELKEGLSEEAFKQATRNSNFALIVGGENKPHSTYTDMYLYKGLGYSTVYIIKKKSLSDLGYKYITSQLGLRSSGKTIGSNTVTIRRYIQEIDKVLGEVIVGKYEDMKPSIEWINAYKREIIESTAAYKRKMNALIFVKNITKGRTEEIKTEWFIKNKTPVIYGYKQDSKLLEKIQYVLNNWIVDKKGKRSRYIVLQVAQKAFSYSLLEESKCLVYCTDFLRSKLMIKIKNENLCYQKYSDVMESIDNIPMYTHFLYGFKEAFDSLMDTCNKNGYVSYSGRPINTTHKYQLIHALGEEYFNLVPSKRYDYRRALLTNFNNKFNRRFPLISYTGISESIKSDKENYKVLIDTLKRYKIRLRKEFYLKSKEQVIEEARQRANFIMFKEDLITLPTTKLLPETITFNHQLKTINNGKRSCS